MLQGIGFDQADERSMTNGDCTIVCVNGLSEKGLEQLTKTLTYGILLSTLMRIETHLSLVLSDKPLSYIGGGLPLRLPAIG
jgi:hypothetical protein